MAEELNGSEQAGDNADAARALVFGYYTKLHDIVLKKIEHAHTATNQSMGDFVSGDQGKVSSALEDLQKYDEFWQELIELFKGAGMSLDGLARIDEVLSGLPKIISKY